MARTPLIFDGLNLNDGTVYAWLPGAELGSRQKTWTERKSYTGVVAQYNVSEAASIPMKFPMAVQGTSLADLDDKVQAINAKIDACSSASPLGLIFAGKTYQIVTTPRVAYVFDEVAVAVFRATFDLVLNRDSATAYVDLPWHSSAIDADGSVMLAAPDTGPLYRSVDEAVSWTKAPPAVGAPYSAAVSSNGAVMLAGKWGGRLHRSLDGGASWAEEQPAGALAHYWHAVAVSGDGNVMLAGCWGGYPAGIHGLYLTVNGTNWPAATWADALPAGAVDKYWRAVAVSGDGNVLLAGINSGRLYVSVNSGATWAEKQPAGAVDKPWYSCAADSDGSVMIASSASRIYLTTNSGGTWAETGPTTGVDKQWRDVSVSDDGSTFFASSRTRLWQSTDGGTTWTELRPIGDVDGVWLLAGASGDGTVLLAGQSSDTGPGGRLYVSSDSGTTWAETKPAP